MSDIMSGRISKVFVNTFADGNNSVSFKLEGDNTYYRTGRNRFAGILEDGKVVKFKYSRVSDKAAKVLGTPRAGSSADAPPASSVGDTGRGFGSTDASIRYQSSRKDALQMAELVLTNGALKLPAKDAAKLEVIEALVDRYTAAFYADIETKGAVARVTPAKTEKPADEAEEAAPEEEAVEDDGDDWE